MAELILADVNENATVAEAKKLSAQIIDSDVTLTATDIDFTGAVLTVTGLDADDTVTVKDVGPTAGQLDVVGYDISFVTINEDGSKTSIIIATIDTVNNGQSGATLTITFTDQATAAMVEAVIEHLALSNDNVSPAYSRDLTITLTDALENTTSATVAVVMARDTIVENVAPIVNEAIPNMTLERHGEFDFNFSDNFADADGDTLTYSIEMVGSDTMPDWMSFDTQTGHFHGTAAVYGPSAVGSFIVTATDGLESVSNTFSVTLGGLAAMEGSTSGNDTLDGNADANIGTLGDGDDVFTAGNGNDIVDGGLGNDTVTGGSGNDDLRGSQGVDILRGSDGDDQLDGGDGNDTLEGGNGNDEIRGGAGNDMVRGQAGNDILIGGSGNDKLSGGTGKDTLSGNQGKDVFDFDTTTDVGKGATRDVITDFVTGSDKIDLSTMDASTNSNGNQTFKFIAAQNFHKKAGEVHYVRYDVAGTANDKTVIEGDVNGDGKADFQIELTGLHKMVAGDFIL